MKTIQKIVLGLLISLSFMSAFAQNQESRHGAEFNISYLRGTQKLHDLMASPMIYYTTYNGLNLGYSRITNKNRWEFGVEAKTGNMISPKLGEREFQIEEGGDSFILAPSQYFGEIRAGYQRKLTFNQQQEGFIGGLLRNEFYYADGLAMNTWALNNLELSLRYAHFLYLGKRHRISGDFSFPLIAMISRLPYSNVVSYPDKSQFSGFLKGTELSSIHSFQHPEIHLAYRYDLAKRSSLEVGYNTDWMHYDEPKTIKKSVHEVSATWIYKFQFHQF